MDELREEFEKAKDSVNKLKALQLRLSKIHIFDPACGSGNFLIIAFKQMKLLEMDIIKRIQEISGEKNFQMNLTSYMHMVWMRAVAGRLKTDYRYSATLVYNTFPFPKISDQQKKRIELCVQEILRIREKYSEKTMAELYDPDKMPKDLLEAHHSLDLVIESF